MIHDNKSWWRFMVAVSYFPEKWPPRKTIGGKPSCPAMEDDQVDRCAANSGLVGGWRGIGRGVCTWVQFFVTTFVKENDGGALMGKLRRRRRRRGRVPCRRMVRRVGEGGGPFENRTPTLTDELPPGCEDYDEDDNDDDDDDDPSDAFKLYYTRASKNSIFILCIFPPQFIYFFPAPPRTPVPTL